MDYEKKLRAFFEGLEMEDIDGLMERSPVELKLIGSVMLNRIKDLKLKTEFNPVWGDFFKRRKHDI